MIKRKSKAFTLIELIAVLVIMAILALIDTPLVMNIIRKAKTAADKRSIDAYGRSIEIAIAGYLLDTGAFLEQMTQQKIIDLNDIKDKIHIQHTMLISSLKRIISGDLLLKLSIVK